MKRNHSTLVAKLCYEAEIQKQKEPMDRIGRLAVMLAGVAALAPHICRFCSPIPIGQSAMDQFDHLPTNFAQTNSSQICQLFPAEGSILAFRRIGPVHNDLQRAFHLQKKIQKKIPKSVGVDGGYW